MNLHPRLAAVPFSFLLSAFFLVCLPGPVTAQVIYVDENFEGETIGQPPTNAAQRNAVQVTVQAGTGPFLGSNVADYNDTSAAGGGDLEYIAGSSGLSNMYISFDLLNPAASGTGAGSNPIIFGLGAWNNATGTQLGANANRAFGLEFSANGTTNTLKLRVNATAVLTTTYDMSSLQAVEIWVNDNDTSTLTYTRPDGLGTGTLGANSFVVFINDTLIGASDAGYTMNPTITTGDSNIGRFGFNSSSTTIAHFVIDDIYAASAVPEASTAALLGLAGMAAIFRRRNTHFPRRPLSSSQN